MLLGITKLFIGYKCLLLSLLFLVPKQYDTSSALIFSVVSDQVSLPWKWLSQAIERLVIWDTVYYVTAAERGMIYEQEWAFGRLWSLLIGALGSYQPKGWQLSSTHWYGFVSIVTAITSHYLATLVLFKITKIIFKRPQMAQTTAFLYTISPAGMFLVSGFSESTFALLSFVGMYLREKRLFVLSGAVFAVGCGIRGNGVLWGIVFLNDLVVCIYEKRWKHALGVLVGGSLIGTAVIGLQLYPYLIYCPERGEWCNNTFPSIFTYVQSHYWNVGFLRYWTPNNIPNFMFAVPTLYLLFKSGYKYGYEHGRNAVGVRIRPYIYVQIVIFISAIFVYHVQIITRIATCLPAMYWYGAELLTSARQSDHKRGNWIVVYCICWTVAQGILFSAFLPPA